MQMFKLEVRCCCDPAKLWGFMDVEEWRLLAGHGHLAFNINSETTAEGFSRIHEPIKPVTTTRVVLELASITYPGLTLGVAIKSHDYPIELLRLLPGFKEATPQEQERGKETAVSTDGRDDSPNILRVIRSLR